MNRWGALTILALAAGMALAGCATMAELRLRDPLQRAETAFADGNFALAATTYESLADRYPTDARRQQMRLRQGLSLYAIASYHDARCVLVGYLREWPLGLYAADAREYLAKIAVLLSPASPAQADALATAQSDLNQLQQLRMAHPYDPKVLYALGNLFYEMGDYDEAVRHYYRAQEIDATYQEKSLIKERMMLDAEGKPVPVSPQAVRQIEQDAQPVVVFDTHDYKSRDTQEMLGGQIRFYNVTGKIRNQGTALLRDVTVQVRFMNMYREILDVREIYLGTMAPGTIRAFIARADSYDSLYNITQYECVASWEK
jgi:tetratricopeptide (TPR) repeat protein